MNLGTALISLLLLVVIVAIIKSIVKDRRAGKNVGCGACKSCVHTTSSQKTSRTSQTGDHPSCAQVDKMLADMKRSADSSSDAPPSQTLH